jgi:glycosyltransferase involved in cell wall biosynthesis
VTTPRPPRVSVVMAAYNGEPYITAAVRSVLDQDFRDLELVVVDDGSTDRTAEIIRSFADARVVYQRNATNRGQTASLNAGLRLARGEYIARIDADDEYLPGKLTAQVRFLDAHPEIALCGTYADCIDEHGATTGTFRPPTDEQEVLFRLTWTSPVCHVSVLARRDALLAVGGYDESYRYAADHHLWSKLAAANYRLANVPLRLMRYRVFEGSFGGASVLADAGWESARIISENARTFCRLELPVDDARAIHLRSHPRWGGEQDRLVAHRRLSQVAGAIYGSVPARIRWDLFAALTWSATRAPTTAPPGKPESLAERAALVLGRIARRITPARMASIKNAVTRLMRPIPR